MATPKPFVHVHDLNSSSTSGLRQSNIRYSATLTSGGGDTTLTVPSSKAAGLINSYSVNKWVAKIVTEQGSTVWFAVGATAAVPVGATFASVSSELIPPEQECFREVDAGDVLHFITADATADVSVTFYSLQN